jgi:signal transduction histidine kinase
LRCHSFITLSPTVAGITVKSGGLLIRSVLADWLPKLCFTRGLTVSATIDSRKSAATAHWQLRDVILPLRGPVLVGILYFLGAEIAFFIGTLSDKIFALFWPPNVILFCTLVVVPKQHWWRYIALALPAHVLAEMTVGMPPLQMTVAFITNCMVALLNAFAVRRWIGVSPWFGTFKAASIYILIAGGAGPAIVALGGALVPILGGGPSNDYWIFWSHWYLANALPNLTIGSVFLIWFANGVYWTHEWRRIEPLLMALAVSASTMISASAMTQLQTSSFLAAVLFTPLPFVLWATVRYGGRGASGAVLIVAIILTSITLRTLGLFPGEEASRGVLGVQLFLMGLSIPVLLLGSLVDELRRKEKSMRRLATSVLNAQDRERRRIARDLHDSTGQHLIAATLIAQRMQDLLPAAALPLMCQLNDMLQQSVRELRTVSYLLHPPLLDEAGLNTALRCYIEGYIERARISVDLDIDPDFGRLAPDVELVLFRIVQEALTNVSLHAQSPTACIRLRRQRDKDGENIDLSIEDAGRGMPHAIPSLLSGKAPSESKLGVGIASMHERLSQIGGRLEIASKTGQTVIRATIPLGPPRY